MEFDIIHRYFSEPFKGLIDQRRGAVGIGDDCATWPIHDAQRVFVSTDTSVQGVHFFEQDDPSDVGWKALAVNLSDLAACGAAPTGFTLCLSLPTIDHEWLSGFSAGLLEIAEIFRCPLIGGDTTFVGHDAPIVISIQVFGSAPLDHGGFLRRLAQPDQDIWVTGQPGLARLGLMARANDLGVLHRVFPTSCAGEIERNLHDLPASLITRATLALQRPWPRVGFAIGLRGRASAMIDISDGLAGDLGHVLNASRVGAILEEASLIDILADMPNHLKSWYANQSLVGGDDYELCFTSDSENREDIAALAESFQIEARVIGKTTASTGLMLKKGHHLETVVLGSHQHFR